MTVNEKSGFAGMIANYETKQPDDHAEAIRIGTCGSPAFGQVANRDGSPSRALVAGSWGPPKATDVVRR